MAKLVAHMRFIAGALALAFMVALAAPVSAQQPSSVNPTAAAVKEQQLLQQLKTIQGRGTIPDVKSYVLEQPAGRDWQAIPRSDAALDRRHRHPRHAGDPRHLLSVARHGEARERPFRPQDRPLQCVRALRPLDDGDLLYRAGDLRPQHHLRQAAVAAAVRPEAFTTWSEWAKYAHNYLSFPFTIGVVLIFLMWIGGNIPNRRRRRMVQARRRHRRR